MLPEAATAAADVEVTVQSKQLELTGVFLGDPGTEIAPRACLLNVRCRVVDAGSMVRVGVISDDLWDVLTTVIPADAGRRGRPWNDHRLTLEAICWRFRTGSPWRDLPDEFGAWQSVWERHRRWSADGTYSAMFAAVKKTAGVETDDLDALVLSVDSTSTKVHQHAAGAPRTRKGGWIELQESAARTA